MGQDGTLAGGSRSTVLQGTVLAGAGSRVGMMTLSMVSLLVGMVLGQRFKVLVLLPAIALALVLALGGGIVRADSAWWIVLGSAAAAVSLQIGYLIGVGIRHVLVAAQASRSPATSLTGSSARRPAH
jgi:hypothetical protein